MVYDCALGTVWRRAACSLATAILCTVPGNDTTDDDDANGGVCSAHCALATSTGAVAVEHSLAGSCPPSSTQAHTCAPFVQTRRREGARVPLSLTAHCPTSSGLEGAEEDRLGRQALQLSTTHSPSHWLPKSTETLARHWSRSVLLHANLPLNIYSAEEWGGILAAIASGGALGVQTLTPSAQCWQCWQGLCDPHQMWAIVRRLAGTDTFRVAFPSLHYSLRRMPLLTIAPSHSDNHQTQDTLHSQRKSDCFEWNYKQFI